MFHFPCCNFFPNQSKCVRVKVAPASRLGQSPRNSSRSSGPMFCCMEGLPSLAAGSRPRAFEYFSQSRRQEFSLSDQGVCIILPLDSQSRPRSATSFSALRISANRRLAFNIVRASAWVSRLGAIFKIPAQASRTSFEAVLGQSLRLRKSFLSITSFFMSVSLKKGQISGKSARVFHARY